MLKHIKTIFNRKKRIIKIPVFQHNQKPIANNKHRSIYIIKPLGSLGKTLRKFFVILSHSFKTSNRRLISFRIKFCVSIILIVITIFGIVPNSTEFVSGHYSTATTDSQGIAHLADNTVNKTVLYDTTTDSSAAVQQQMGQDPNWQAGITRESYALKYNGTSNYAVTSSAMPSLGNYLTFELWSKTATRGSYQTFFGDGSQHNTVGFIWMYRSTGTDNLAYQYSNGSGYTTATATGFFTGYDNVYIHIAVTADYVNKIINFYRNGELFYHYDAGDNMVAPTTSRVLYVGSYNVSMHYMSNLIDEARISKDIHYNGNFSAQKRLIEDQNTLALWHFDEGAGTSIADSSGMNRTLSIAGNAPTWVSGINAVMDGFKGDSPDSGTTTGVTGAGGRTGAANLTLGPDSSTTNDKTYDVKVAESPALSFSGSSQFAAMGTSSTLAVSTKMTLEAWIYPTTGTNQMIVNRENDYEIALTAGTIQYAIHNTSPGWAWIDTGYAPTVNSWTHIVWQYDSTAASNQLTLYANGVLVHSRAGSGSVSNSGDVFRVGARGGPAAFWIGKIDEVRLSNIIRYNSAFTPSRRFATDGNTLGLWHFDEGTGLSVADVSGNGNTGDLTGHAPTWSTGIAASASPTARGGGSSSTNWALPGYQYRQPLTLTNNIASIINPGYGVEATNNRGTVMDNNQSRADGKDWRVMYQPPNAKNSMSFDGSDKRITTTYGNSINPATQPLSFSMWVKTTTPSASQIFFSTNTGTNQRLYLSTYGGYWDFGIQSSAWGGSHGPAVISGAWTLFTVIMDGSNAKLYINGDFAVQKSYTSYAFASDFMIGRFVTGSYYFTGNLDDVRVYTRAITMPELSSLYSSGQGNGTAIGPNLAGWWKMDEGSGQIIRDYSGSENNAVLGADINAASDDPTWSTDGVVSTNQEVPREIPNGHSLNFDGSTTYISVPTSASLNIRNDITLEAWVNVPNTTGKRIINKSRAWYSDGDYELSTNQFALYVDGLGYPSGFNSLSYTIPTNQWAHVAATYDGDWMRVYVNGVDVAHLQIGSHTIDSRNEALGIGANLRSDNPSQSAILGQIDEVRISNTVRYRSNFTPATTPFSKDQFTAGLWHIDNGSGTTVTDSSGNGNNGDLTGHAPTWVLGGGKVKSTNQTQFKTVAPIAASSTDKNYYIYYGNPGESSAPLSYESYGVKLDGTDDYVNLSSSIGLAGAFSLAYWYKESNNALQNMIIGSPTGQSGGGPKIGQSSSNFFVRIISSSDNTIALPTVNVWHMVVITRDGSNVVSLSVDGAAPSALFSSAAQSGTYTVNRLGANGQDGSQAFAGSVDNFMVYARNLSTAEIAALYSNSPYVSSSNLSCYWKLDDGAISTTTTATDSSGNGVTGTLTNFNFDQNSNWITNTSLWHAATEPTITNSISAPEQESPIFYSWAQSGGAWSTPAQISSTYQQLGSEGVYVKWNPAGLYSVNDKYRIASWAPEAFSSSAPARGRPNGFPTKANLIASNGGLDIIDATTNDVWMRLSKAASNLIGDYNTLSVKALNGRIYIASADGLTEIRFDEDTIYRYTTSGISVYGGNIADRADALGFAGAAGNAIVDNSLQDVAVQVIGTSPPKTYVAAAADNGISVINNITSLSASNKADTTSPIYDYAKTANDNYLRIALTTAGKVYGANATAGGLDVYSAVNADSADQVGTADLSYSTSSTPALRSNAINDIAVTEGTSAADYASNQVALGTDLGVEMLNEHSTQASGFVEHYVPTGAVGSSNYSSKKLGQALYIDGANDYVNVGNPSTLQVEAGDFSSSAWIYATASKCGMYAIDKGSNLLCGTATNGGWTIGGVGATIKFIVSDFANTQYKTLSAAAPINNWYFVTGVRSGNNIYLYVNGALVQSDTITGFVINSRNLAIGGGTATNNWPGYIDDVRIYNRALSVTEIGQIHTGIPSAAPTSGLVGYWDMNERAAGANGLSSQYVYDSSGNNNNGTLGANTTVNTDDPVRISPSLAGSTPIVKTVGFAKSADTGQGLSFDGGDYLSVPHNASQNSATALSISSWINLSQLGDFHGILGKSATIWSNCSYAFRVVDTNKLNILLSNNGNTGVYTELSSNTTLAANTWYFVTAVFSKPNIRLYINGVQDNTASWNNDLYSSTSPLIIGGYTYGNGLSYLLHGKIDDTRLFTRALTGAEVESMYNGGIGESSSSLTGMVGWWKSNEGQGQSVSDLTGVGNNATRGADASSGADDPTWASGSPVKSQLALWVGTSDGAGGGAISAISLNTGRQVTSFTTTNSSLPSNNISTLGLGGGGLALVGTSSGAWPAGMAGFPVDDTAAAPATDNKAVRVESGTVRIKSGTVRIAP